MTKKREKIKNRKTDRDYVDNKSMTRSLSEYKRQRIHAEQNGLPKPKVPEDVGTAIIKIAENLAKKPMFSGYTYKEDMIGDGIINCLLYIDNFDPDISSNSFSYFTRIIWNAFLRRLEAEQKESYVKFKSLTNTNLFNSMEGEDNKNVNLLKTVLNENTDGIITKFETRMENKKNKRKAAIAEAALTSVQVSTLFDEDINENSSTD
jgi:hypothetical protein